MCACVRACVRACVTYGTGSDTAPDSVCTLKRTLKVAPLIILYSSVDPRYVRLKHAKAWLPIVRPSDLRATQTARGGVLPFASKRIL